MNKFITAVTGLDAGAVSSMIDDKPALLDWAEPTGKNALHYLCGTSVGRETEKAAESLSILKLLLARGMDINAVHRIDDKNCDHFPATPLWYAYTRGRNEKLYKYLLKQGADNRHCWWAIAWYDDIAAGKLWLKHGAKIDERPTPDELFIGSFQWKKFDFAYWLLEHGADVDDVDKEGNTALVVSVKRKDEDNIKRLIKRGADPNFKNSKGMSAVSIAKEKGPRRLLELLEKGT